MHFDKVWGLRNLVAYTQDIGLRKRVVYYNELLVEGTGPSTASEWLEKQLPRWIGGTLATGQYNLKPQWDAMHVSTLQQFTNRHLNALRQSFIEYYRRECTDSINTFMGSTFFFTLFGLWAGPMGLSKDTYQALMLVFWPAFLLSTGNFYYEAVKTIERDTGENRAIKFFRNARLIFQYTSVLSWNFPQGFDARKKTHEPREFISTRVGASVKIRPPKKTVYWQTRGLATNFGVLGAGISCSLMASAAPFIPLAFVGYIMAFWGFYNVVSWVAAQSIRSDVKNPDIAKRDQIVQRLGMWDAVRETWRAKKGSKREMFIKWGPFAALDDFWFYYTNEPWMLKIARTFNPKATLEH